MAEDAPLAERMRPRSLRDFIGQTHLFGPRGILTKVTAGGRLPSLVLVGPPGVGKTSIARLLAGTVAAEFITISATDSGVGEVRDAVARARAQPGRRTVLFIDEIHRFNRAQQDALLPHVESGTLTLIGATTEHPSFHLNAALVSRTRVVELRGHAVGDLVELARRALQDEQRGVAAYAVDADDDVLAALAHASDGDARRTLNALELAVDFAVAELSANEHGRRCLSLEHLAAALGKRRPRYDRSGEEHYAVTSALIKSMRASDPDAAVYWLARMVEGGEDPVFVARRLVIFASEDVGNADPQALVVAEAAARAVQFVGMPEAVLPLSQATQYLALARKSNHALKAYFAARREIRKSGSLEVPLDIRNAVTAQRRASGHGVGYRYPHDFDGSVDPHHRSHLPQPLAQSDGRHFVPVVTEGWQGKAERHLAAMRGRGEAPPTLRDRATPRGPHVATRERCSAGRALDRCSGASHEDRT